MDDPSFVWWISCSGRLPQELHNFGTARPIGGAMGQQVWEISASLERMNGLLSGLLRAGQVYGAALVEPDTALEELWRATEWAGSLVVSRRLAQRLHVVAEILEGPWETVGPERSARHVGFRLDECDGALAFLVLRPVVSPGPEQEARPAPGDDLELVTEAGAYRARVTSNIPTAIDVYVGEVLDRPDRWFGDLVGGPVGGGMALLSLSGRPKSYDRIRLRNAAALGLVTTDSADAVSGYVRSGVIGCRAWGVSGDAPPSGWPKGATPMQATTGDRAAYRIYLLLEAVVDPEVEIEVGTIFEQTSLNGVQTLATAAPHRATVHPGYPARVVLDAWCLNADLSPPQGQAVRVTGLRLGSVHGSQSAVWAERARWVGRP